MTELELRHRLDLIEEITDVALLGINAQSEITSLKAEIEDIEG
jgi:hypothetical protein